MYTYKKKYCLVKNKLSGLKKLILIFFTILINTCTVAQEINPNGYNKFTYPDGSVSSEGYMKNGKPVAYWKTYYPDGKLKTEGNRKNEKLDSVWRFYGIKGNLTKP